MNYLDNLTTLAEKAGQSAYATDVDFLTEIPRFIDSAEQRIFRDLDLLSTRVEDNSGALSEHRRKFTLPISVGTFIVLESLRIEINSVAQPPLTWLSREALDYAYPDEHPIGIPSIPRYIAPNDQVSVLIGPAPDQAYVARCFGTQRPLPLYTGVTVTLNTTPPTFQIASNSIAATGSFISTQLVDLFIAAQMIAVSGWQRKFSAMEGGDQSVSWTTEYERIKTPALIEEMRKKLQGGGWGTKQPIPAKPPQT